MPILKTALAAALALGLAVQPQQVAAAEGEDIAKALAGLAALAIIAKAVDDRKDSKKRKAAETTRSGRIGNFGSRDNRRIIDGRVLPYGRAERRDYRKLALPKECLRRVETRFGSRPAYASNCLDHNYRHARHLPEACETLIRTSRGLRAVYGARCLARDGWRVARH